MNQGTDFKQRRSDIRQATERLIGQRPFLEPILRPYAAISIEKVKLLETLVQTPRTDPLPVDPAGHQPGVPMVNGQNVQGLRESLNLCFPEMLRALKEAFAPLAPQMECLAALPRRMDLGQLAGAFLTGDASSIEKSAGSQGVDPEVLDLALRCTLGPVLASVGLAAEIQTDRFGANDGTCPICGALPAVSSLSPAGDLGSEFLRGGGGQRHLHCGLCGFQWRIGRGKCPACGNEDHEKRRVFRADEACGERLDICLACKAYLPGIDLRESPLPLPLDIAAVGMCHLDAWALENGYHPLVQTPWNSIR